MKVNLIENPCYSVDFESFVPKDTWLSSKGNGAVWLTANRVLLFFKNFAKTFFKIVCAGSTSEFFTTHPVLPDRKVKTFFKMCLVSFEAVYWILVLELYSIIAIFLVLIVYFSKTPSFFDLESDLSLLDFKKWMSPGINPLHIQEKTHQVEVCLNMSAVPKEIKVDDLISIFEKINFMDPDAFEYMPLEKKEEGGQYAPKELKLHLEAFIRNVNEQTPRVGTPSAFNPDQVKAFYRGIEDLVRFTLHQLNSDLEKFLEKCPNPSNRGEREGKTYRNLLENRARVVIDLAVSGQYCGARYLAQALESYQMVCCHDAVIGKTLRETLLETLKAERKKIVDREVVRIFGTNWNNVHGYTYYMERMGPLLNIAGSGHAIEPLPSRQIAHSFNLEKAVQRFLTLYSEECVIDAIQEKIKTSRPFREQIIGWMQEQVVLDGNWKPKGFFSTKDVVDRMKKVQLEKESLPAHVVEEVRFFIDAFNLRVQNRNGSKSAPPFPNLSWGWAECVTDLFSLDEVKKAFSRKYPKLSRFEQLKKEHALCQKMGKGALGDALKTRYLKAKRLDWDQELVSLLIELEKVQKMQSILGLSEETLLRVLRGNASLKESVTNHLQRLLQGEFLEALYEKYHLEAIEEKGLHPLLIEWLLDFHHIFIPRKVVQYKNKALLFSKGPIDLSLKEVYRKTIDPRGDRLKSGCCFAKDRKKYRSRLREKYGRPKRYVFGLESERDRLSLSIFEKAFEEKGKKIVQIAENIFPDWEGASSKWETQVLVPLLEKGAATIQTVCSNLLFLKMFGSLVNFLILGYLDRLFLSCISQLMHPPLVRRKAPLFSLSQVRSFPLLFKALKHICNAHRFLLRNGPILFVSIRQTYSILSEMETPLSEQIVQWVVTNSIFSHHFSSLCDLWDMSESCLSLALVALEESICFYLNSKIDQFKEKRAELQKQFCYSLWNQILQD